MIDQNQKIYKHKETGRIVVETTFPEPSLTQQQFKDECDINNIMKKFASTGEFTHVTSNKGIYADFTEIKDYQSMLDTVIYADHAFNTLPAELRKRFNNNAGELLDFIQDPSNYDEGVKLGLLNPKTNSNLSTQQNTDNNAKQTNDQTNEKTT